jgi:hypothetical protein
LAYHYKYCKVVYLFLELSGIEPLRSSAMT